MMKPTQRDYLIALYGTLFAIGCAGYFVDPTLLVIAGLATLSALWMKLELWVFGGPGSATRQTPPALLLGIALALLAASVYLYATQTQIGAAAALLGMAIHATHLFILASASRPARHPA